MAPKVCTFFFTAFPPKVLTKFLSELQPEEVRGLYHEMTTRSQLLANLLLRVRQHGDVALPIHDAILVKASQADNLKILMEWTAVKMLGQVIPVEMKRVA